MEDPTQPPITQSPPPTTKKSNPLPFIIGAIIIFILGLLFGYALSNMMPKPNNLQVQQATPTITQIAPTVTPMPQTTIKDLIQLQTPSGWAEKTASSASSSYGELQLISPDLVPGAVGGPQTNAVVITFTVKRNQPEDALNKLYQDTYNEIHNPSPAGAVSHDLTKTTVAGLPANSAYDDFEGHYHGYDVKNGSDIWTIIIYSPSAKYEDQHKAEIDMVLSSIKFTK